MIAAHKSVNRADIGIGTSSNKAEMSLIGASKTETLNNESATRDSIRRPGVNCSVADSSALSRIRTVRPHWLAVRRTDTKHPRYHDVLEAGQRKQHCVFIISRL